MGFAETRKENGKTNDSGELKRTSVEGFPETLGSCLATEPIKRPKPELRRTPEVSQYLQTRVPGQEKVMENLLGSN